MAWFEQLETRLRDLYLNSSSHAVDAFKLAFHSFFGEEHQTFRLKMFHHLDQRDLLENLDTLEAVIHRAVIKCDKLQLQSQDVQINPVQAVDDSLIILKSSWIELENNNALSKSVNETQLQQTQLPFAEVQLTAQHNVLASEQQHTEQSEPIYDTYLLDKVDSNTTPDSTNMCHRGGEIDQDAELYQAKSPLLKAEFLKTNDMVEKEVYNELSNRFLQLEKHCISLEISMQQKEESFQSNKPCKNQDAPEFCEFFEINDLKAQLQAKTTLICNLKNQIKSVKEASNEAKTVENADLKAQIQEKVFANVALKNELRKLKGNSMDTKFAKPSILGKPVIQLPRNHSVVRQPNAFKSERPNVSKPWFASQVDVNNVLSKPGLVQNLVSSTPYVPPSKKDYEILFQPLFDEYFNPPPRVVSLDPVAVAAQELLIKMYHLLILHQQIRKFNLKSFFKEVHDVSNDEENKTEAVVAEKQARYVQTNLTLSSAELEIQSMVDVPIHQEDLAVQRTLLIDPVISMVTEKTASTPTPPTTQAHV
ncbi:hypothetical protein Tco_0006269 [Tanacetum coccineum]